MISSRFAYAFVLGSLMLAGVARADAPAAAMAAQSDVPLPPSLVQLPRDEPQVADAAAQRRAGKTKVVAAIVVGAVGLGALAAGVDLEIMAKRDADTLAALDATGGVYQPALDRGPQYALWGPIALGVGGAAIATGVVLAILGSHQLEKSRIALTPSVSMVGGTSLHLALTGAFE